MSTTKVYLCASLKPFANNEERLEKKINVISKSEIVVRFVFVVIPTSTGICTSLTLTNKVSY